jgi:HK97 gp10 family phage protein
VSKVDFVSHLNEVIKQIEATNKRNLTNATVTLFRAVQKKLTGPRTGETYKVPGTQKEYTASAPGEPPARRTGALANSIKYRLINNDTSGIVGTNNDYAMPLEKGTSKMKPRPYFQPAVDESLSEIKRILSTP